MHMYEYLLLTKNLGKGQKLMLVIRDITTNMLRASNQHNFHETCAKKFSKETGD